MIEAPTGPTTTFMTSLAIRGDSATRPAGKT